MTQFEQGLASFFEWWPVKWGALQELVIDPRTPQVVLLVVLVVMAVRAALKLRRWTVRPVWRVFALLGSILLMGLLITVSAAFWLVEEPTVFHRACKWLVPYESLGVILFAVFGVVWVIAGFIHPPDRKEKE